MTTAVTASPTYLDRCTEQSSPGNISSLWWKSTLWKTAAVATYVAFAALTLGAIAGTLVYMPVYVPLVAIGSLVTMSFVNMPYKYFDNNAESAKFNLRQARELSNIEQELASLNSDQLQTALVRKGIHWFTIPGMVGHPEALKTLIPFFAKYNQYEEKREKCEKEMKEAFDEVAKLTAENKSENRKRITDLNISYLECEQAALKAKISAAFMSAVIQRPRFAGKFSDIGSFWNSSTLERAIGMAVNPAPVSEFFSFKTASLPKITYDEAKRMTVPQLATRFITAL